LWNEAPGQFTFNDPPRWGDGSCGRENEQNEIWCSNNPDLLDSAPAICWYVDECWCFLGCTVKRIEADVIFDASGNWSYFNNSRSTKRAYDPTGRRPFELTALHEMGHALGLAHADYTYNIMGEDWTHIHANDEAVIYYAGEDAGNGDVFLYGAEDDRDIRTRNDLGVTHWKYGGSDGEYSVHILTVIYANDGSTVIASDPFQQVERFRVRAGSEYQVEFTYENNGVDDIDEVDVAHYISTDNWITSRDRRIRTGTLGLNRNRVYTASHSVTIPADLIVGQTYFIGAIVDYMDHITEHQESNNATYTPILIIP